MASAPLTFLTSKDSSSSFVNSKTVNTIVLDSKVSVSGILKEFHTNKKNISYVPLEDVFSKSDVISLHLSLSKKTKNLVNKNLLNLMKKDALLVNTSRGEIINEVDLYNFLKKNKNIQVSLDVLKKEPYQGQLLELPNIFITPHISAYAKETRVEMEIEAVKNLIKSI